jgi:hypothetical protein
MVSKKMREKDYNLNQQIKVLKKVVTNSLFNKNLTIRIRSMIKNRLVKTSILLIVIGILLSIVILTIYVPKYAAFRNATLAWDKNPNGSTPPTPETFGLDMTTIYIFTILSYAANTLLLIGWAYLVIYLITKILARFKYQK